MTVTLEITKRSKWLGFIESINTTIVPEAQADLLQKGVKMRIDGKSHVIKRREDQVRVISCKTGSGFETIRALVRLTIKPK